MPLERERACLLVGLLLPLTACWWYVFIFDEPQGAYCSGMRLIVLMGQRRAHPWVSREGGGGGSAVAVYCR